MTKMADTMDGLATLITDAGLAYNVYPWPVDAVTVPCAVVGYPTEIDFDLTFGRGGDRLVYPVWFMVGRTGNKDSRTALSDILSDAASVKSALDGSQTFGSVRVVSATVEEVTVSSVAYLAARFEVEVLG